MAGRISFRVIQAVGVRRWGAALALVLLAWIAWQVEQAENVAPVAAPSAPQPLRRSDPVYAVPIREQVVAFAVNVDWGAEVLPDMLNVFDERDVRATFFPTGRFAEQEAELVREIVRRGHELGNHGYRHDHPKRLSDAALRDDIVRTQNVLRELAGVATRLYAPPYGEVDGRIARVAAETGHWTIMWTLDTIDWQRPNPETIVSRVAPRVQPGAIVLMHPTEPTVAALPTIIDRLAAAGWTVAPVGELIDRASDAPIESSPSR